MVNIKFLLLFSGLLVSAAAGKIRGNRQPRDVDFITYYDCSNKQNGNYYHPTDCTKFITCSNGFASERDCPSCSIGPSCPSGRLYFDEPRNTCLEPIVANCVQSVQLQPSIRPQPRDVDFITYYDCSNKQNGNYYHPTDCTKFITCSNGFASERDCASCSIGPSCPTGRLYFDEPRNTCLEPIVANC